MGPLRLLFVVWIASLLVVSTGHAQESPNEASLDEQIETLRQQISDLLAKVPESERDEVLLRLLAPTTKKAPEQPVTEELVEDEAPAEDTPEPTLAEDPSAAPAETKTPAPSSPTVSTPPPTPVASKEPATTPRAEPTEAPRRPRRRSRCNTLNLFDENDDAQVTVVDRYWRYLYLWVDENRDGVMSEEEVESAYARGVREIALDLHTFVRKKKGGQGEIRREGGFLVLDLQGDGFGNDRRPDDAVLAVDTTALARNNGPRVLGPDGQPLEGIQPFRAGWQIVLGDQRVELTCP